MKPWTSSLLFSALLTATAQTAISADLTPVAVPKLERAVGQRPMETRLPAVHLLNRFRSTSLLINLGGTRYQLSVQPRRTGEWDLVLLKEGDNVHSPATTAPLTHPNEWWPLQLQGTEYYMRPETKNGRDILSFSAATDGRAAVQTIEMDEIKRADFAAGAPVDSMGSQWRVLYESELWSSAGQRSLIFIEQTQGGPDFHLVRADSIDDPREHIGDLGSAKVSLSLDADANIVIRPVP